MARRRRKFSLGDFGVQLPDTSGLGDLASQNPVVAQILGIGEEQDTVLAPTVIDTPLLVDPKGEGESSDVPSGGMSFSEPQEVPKGSTPQRKAGVRQLESGAVVDAPQQTQERFAEADAAIPEGLTDNEIQQIQEDEAFLSAFNNAQRVPGIGGGISGIGSLFFLGKAKRARERLLAARKQAAVRSNFFKNRREMAALSSAESAAKVAESKRIQTEQLDAYEGLNIANLTGGIKDIPSDVLADMEKKAGVVRNQDGTLPLFEDDLIKVHGAKNIAKWSMADGGFRQNLKSIFSVDTDLNKPLLDSLARARKRSLELEKATAEVARSKFLLKDAKGKLDKDNLTKVNTVLNSMFDNASGVGRTWAITDEQIPLMNALLQGQGRNLERFMDNNKIPMLEETRKFLQNPTAPPPDPTFNLFGPLGPQGDDTPSPLRPPNEQQVQHMQTVEGAVDDMRNQIQKRVGDLGGANQREGNVTQIKDTRKKPRVASGESVSKSGKSRAELLKEKRELERKRRRR